MADIADTRALHDAAAAPAHDEHEESFREQVRARIIGLGSMDRRLRLVVGVAVAQLLVAAIMVALRELHLPSVIGDVTDNEESAIPVATFVVAVVFLTVAWSFLLAGVMHAHWLLRIPALGLFVWAFAANRDTVGDHTSAMVAAAALMAAIAGLTLASIVRDARRPADASRQHLFVSRLLPLIPLVGGLYITAWISSQSVDDVENFTTSVAVQLYNLEYLLIPVLILAGADFADWGYLIGGRVADAARAARANWPLLLAGVVVGAAMLADALRVLEDDRARSIGLGAILVAVFLAVLWLARPRAVTGHAHLPFAALAVVVVLDATLGFLVEQRVTGSSDYVGDRIYASSALMWVVIGFLGVVLLASRRNRLPTWLVLATAFAILVGACDALFGLQSVATVFPGLHLDPESSPLDLDGVRAVAGIVTLVVVAAVALRRRGRSGGLRILTAVLAADVGIQVLAWVDQLFNRSAQVADQVTRGFSVWAAVVLLLALILEIVGSGEAITNRHDRGFPRQSRVLLYLGYVVLVAAAVLYFASLHDPASGALRESQFDSESWVHQGVLFLGVPLVLTMTIATLLHRRHDGAAHAAEEHEHSAAALPAT